MYGLGPDSCTISGPEADIAQFVAELKSQGVFAKEVFIKCLVLIDISQHSYTILLSFVISGAMFEYCLSLTLYC